MGLEEAFAQDWGRAYGFWRDLNSTRPVGFGLGMIPATAAAQYLAMLGETQDVLAKVLLLEETLYPYLSERSKEDHE